MRMPEMWMDGSTVDLELTSPSGKVFVMPLPLVVIMAQISDGEIVRFTYDRTDPETGLVMRGAARLVLQDLPDPRDRKTEEQPPAAEATALHPMIRTAMGGVQTRDSGAIPPRPSGLVVPPLPYAPPAS